MNLGKETTVKRKFMLKKTYNVAQASNFNEYIEKIEG